MCNKIREDELGGARRIYKCTRIQSSGEETWRTETTFKNRFTWEIKLKCLLQKWGKGAWPGPIWLGTGHRNVLSGFTKEGKNFPISEITSFLRMALLHVVS